MGKKSSESPTDDVLCRVEEFVDGLRMRFESEEVSTEVTGGRKDLMARVGYQDAEGNEIAHTDHWFREPGDVRGSQVFGR